MARDLAAKTYVLLAFNALLLMWLVARPASQATVVLVDNVVQFVGPLLFAAWCWRARLPVQPDAPAQIGKGRRRPVVAFLLGMGTIAYSVGQMIWAYYEHVLHQKTPFPSWADAGYLSAYPFLLAGILLLPARSLPAALKGRVVLDSLMTMTAVVTFSWYFVLGPTILAGAETTLGKILGMAYPLGDLVLVFCLLLLSVRSEQASLGRAVPPLLFGLACVVVTDALFGYQTLHGTYASGALFDIGWPLGYMLICVAARAVRAEAGAAPAAASAPAHPIQNRKPAGESDAPRESARASRAILWRSLLPYALVPAVGGLLIFTRVSRGDPRLVAGVDAGSALLIGLVLVRQVFAILENNKLYGFLREAYQELEDNNTRLAVANEQLAEANRLLERYANSDGMTGLANHRRFQEDLRAELHRAEGEGLPLSLLLIDVDRFKQYNDQFGHPAGDEVLSALGRLLRTVVGEAGLAARYGGEEFAVLLPGADLAAGYEVAERIRCAAAAHPFVHREVTLSIGVTDRVRGGNDPEALVASADRALYGAKRAGRNRVETAPLPSNPVMMRRAA